MLQRSSADRTKTDAKDALRLARPVYSASCGLCKGFWTGGSGFLPG